MDVPIPQKPNTTQKSGEPASIGGRPAPHLDAGGTTLTGFTAANANQQRSPQPNLKSDIVADLHKDQKIPNMRTLESDAAEAVQQHNLSAVSIAAQKIQQTEPLTPQSQKTNGTFKKVGMIIGILLLLIIGIATVTYAFIIAGPKSISALQSTTAQKVLINVDDIKTVSVPSRQSTLNAWLGAEKMLSTENATVVQINFTAVGTTTPMDSQSFLNDLGATSIPSWFVRAIGTQYVVGFYHNNSNWNPFMIFSVTSYDNAFAGMLQWENNAANDLAPLYERTAATVSTAAVLSSTTSSSISSSTPITLSSPPTWSDTFIANKNVRVLSTTDNQPLLLYSFPEQNVLIITTSNAAMTEIFNRLVARQFVQ